MNNVKVVGNLFDESNKFKAAGRVYDGGGIAPTLGSCHFQSDKYLIETKELKVEDNLVLIRQATNEGTIPCKIGGGGGFELPRLTDQARKSNRERRDKPDSNDGEYP